MLSAADNALMCQVGPGTPMGNLMRHFWIPAVMSNELETPDGPPMRLRLLGENLIAFRVSSGSAGIIQNACPHRGASMFFGRNEEDGLRCVYHGWKFDVTGACVDMPSEPAESNFKNKVRTVSYPCIERNNIVWTYMGPRKADDLPPLPELPPNLANCRVVKSVRTCNYMQALEGDIDTIHIGFLHHGVETYDEYPVGSERYYAYKQRVAKLEVRENEAGTYYGAYRAAEDNQDNWRMGHFLMPFYTMSAAGILGQKNSMNAWVPIDDEHTMDWSINEIPPAGRAPKEGIGGIFSAGRIGYAPRSPERPMKPDTTDWIGKFRSVYDLSNDYMIDREAQRNRITYSGMPGGAEPEDRGMQESMGPIFDRTQEHLGTTDAMVIQTRRKLIQAVRDLHASGKVPAAVKSPQLYRVYGGTANVPKGQNGLDFCRDVLFGGTEKVEAVAGT
jgi:phthalate 4,5-dioxygenase oxygenase subunit